MLPSTTLTTTWNEAAARYARPHLAVDQPDRLGSRARSALEDASNDVSISAATIWEIAIKTGLGKPTLSLPYRDWMNRPIADLGSTVLPITAAYADMQATLPSHHRDPFDRMLIAQAMVEQIPLVANEDAFDQ
jgi:PIN domain nuclease of toxin-antitoxin system